MFSWNFCGPWVGGSTLISASNVDSVVTVLFFGGRDGHEALTYGSLMAEHPGISLVVVRFVLHLGVVGKAVNVDMGDLNVEEERSFDDEVIADFKQKMPKGGSVKFEEREAKDAAKRLKSFVNIVNSICL